MSNQKNVTPGIPLSQVYKFTPRALRNQPAIVVPFAVFAAVELLFLVVLYFFPRQPFAAVFAPPIRVFWGESFLHYPGNFLLFPQLASISRTLLYIVAGSLLNAMAVLFVQQAYSGEGAGEPVLLRSLRRYGALFAISLSVTAVFMLFVRAATAYSSFYFSRHDSLLLLPAQVWQGPVVFIINLLAGIILQSSCIYAIPVLMTERSGIIRAIARSWRLFAKMPRETLALVTIPVLVYVPVMVLQYKTAFLVAHNPESVFYIAVAGSLINSLFVDVLVTVSITYLYLKMREV